MANEALFIKISRKHKFIYNKKHYPLSNANSVLLKGGYRDSNPGPPEPQSGALTNCAIPTIIFKRRA